MKLHLPLLVLLLLGWTACQNQGVDTEPTAPAAADALVPDHAYWNNATIYFLLTDRFYNGNPDNDQTLGRKRDGAFLRNFIGGDLPGVTEKIESGYFDSLGVNAIWMTPVVEQIHGSVDEGTGMTYGYHGYWARDWTRLDPNFGAEQDLQTLIQTAHEHDIRILMDVVINHTGPVSPLDPQWPEEWVRVDPTCTYQDFASTVSCTLVENLPDIRTDREEPVELPSTLLQKWEREGRKEQELSELDAFFERTGYPRAPRFYLIKWLTDWVRQYGVDGYRIDTAKHFEAKVSKELTEEARKAYEAWKAAHPEARIDDRDFFVMGEVYGFNARNGRAYHFGDRQIDFFNYGYESLINFGFKLDAELSPDSLFSVYSSILNEGGALDSLSVLNYVTSHDDGSPFDRRRERSLEAATKLLLSPGGAQVYYGDETARPLFASGARGDANLRTPMNWEDIEANTQRTDYPTKEILEHWRKLGQFRRAHLAVGAGVHEALRKSPYLFRRTYRDAQREDQVVVAMDLPEGPKEIPLFGTFPDGTELRDYYSGRRMTVENDQVTVESPFTMVLLGIEE